jgi:hypothetical protein
MRMLVLCLAGAIGCADVPDYDDPREVPLEDDPSLSCSNLLHNGNFDTTPLTWSLQPADLLIDQRNLSADHPFYAYSGYYFAWFGGSVTTATKVGSQRVDVPRTSKLRLVGKYFVAAVTTAGRVEDTVKLEIVDAAGNVLATAASFTNLDSISETATFSWKDLRVEIASQAFAGKSVAFRITSANDAANNTNLLFDSLQLVPGGCF